MMLVKSQHDHRGRRHHQEAASQLLLSPKTIVAPPRARPRELDVPNRAQLDATGNAGQDAISLIVKASGRAKHARMVPMRLFPYRAPYTAVRKVLSWLPRTRGHRSAERGSARVGAARPTPVIGGQLPCSARPTTADRIRSAPAMPIPITPTARRIAHVHNCCGPALSGGLLGFDSEGRGGAWYAGRSQPSAEIVYPVGRGRVSVRDVQTWLNERERGRARRAERSRD